MTEFSNPYARTKTLISNDFSIVGSRGEDRFCHVPGSFCRVASS